MRVLLVHPEDGLLNGPWAREGWDRLIDLGFTGEQVRRTVAAQLGCAVDALHSLSQGLELLRRVRDLLGWGRGRLLDQYQLDWWELTSIMLHQQLERAILIHKLAQTVDAGDEIWLTRPGFEANAVASALGRAVKTYALDARYDRKNARHYLRLARKFSPSELLGIFWDKNDPGYQIRGRLSPTPKPFPHPVVLLPTAYVNASRTALEYARCLPDVHFVLVATRRSGWIEQRPANVAMRWLRSYASIASAPRQAEGNDLDSRWRALREELLAIPEFRMLNDAGSFDSFSDRIRVGLEVRDAWRNVLAVEPVESVICADDSNPNTQLPVLLARNAGLPSVVCHHGALDGRYTFKRPQADRILAKGRMEEDYLVRVCKVPHEQVELGAGALPNLQNETRAGEFRPWIVVFSELYEAGGGRAADFYLDMLPPLAKLAAATGRELIVKLHPAESVSERKRLIHSALGASHSRLVQVRSGPLTPDLLHNAWFGVTVLSTVALECALRGIPCFLCKWLEAWPYAYVDQFARFEIGIPLSGPAELARIPEMLEHHKPRPSVRADCWTPVASERLRQLLGISHSERTPATSISA